MSSFMSFRRADDCEVDLGEMLPVFKRLQRGLKAAGVTEDDVAREMLEEKLAACGADIERIEG